MKNKIVATAITSLLLISGTAGAATTSTKDPAKPIIYVGGDIGFSVTGDLVDNTTDALQSTGLVTGTVKGNKAAFVGGFFVGADYSKNVGIRIGWTHLGKYHAKLDGTVLGTPFDGKLSESWSALTASLLLKAPLQTSRETSRSVYLKLGYARTQSDYESSGDFGSASGQENTVDTFVPGIGIESIKSEHWRSIAEVNYYPKLAGSGDGYKFSMVVFKLGLAYQF